MAMDYFDHNDRFKNHAGKKPKIKDPFSGGRCLNAIWQNKNITDKEKIVLQALATKQNFTKNFQLWESVTHDYIANFGSISEGTVKRTLKSLNDKGYIQIAKRFKDGKQIANEYRITPKIFEDYMSVKPTKGKIVRVIEEPTEKAEIETDKAITDQSELAPEPAKTKPDLINNKANKKAKMIRLTDHGDLQGDHGDLQGDHGDLQGDHGDLDLPVFLPSSFPSSVPLSIPEKNKKENQNQNFDKNLTALFTSNPVTEKRFLGSHENGLVPIENIVAAMELEIKQFKRESFKTG